MIKIKTITTALLAMALATACTPQAEELAATTQPVTLMPTATIVSNGTAAVTRATTNEVGITLSDGTLNLTMDDVEKEYTVGTGGALTTATPHKALVGSTHAFAVAEAKVTGTIEHENKPLPMNLNVAMTKQDLTVAAGGAVALPLAPTTAGMRLVLKTDAVVEPTTVTCMPSGEVAPKSGTTTPTTDSRIVPLTAAPYTYAVAFGMLPAGTKVDAGAPLAMIEITGNKTLALLAPAPITLAAGEMVTYTVHVDHSVATITGVKIDGFATVDGGSIGVGDNRIAMATGLETDLAQLLTGKTIWVITGTDVTKVKAALDALNNNPAAAGTIHLIMPNFAGSIGTGAFYGCTALASFSAPEATDIGEYAFNSCKALTSVSIPKATNIGASAFRDCAALATISLPLATDIGENAFADCDALTTISLPKTETIGEGAFGGCNALTSVSIPNAKGIIGKRAFDYCPALTTINLPLVTELGYNAFSECTALTTINLPAATSIRDNAFEKCKALTTISLPAATSIGYYVFKDCDALTTVSLPAATSINSYAFESCPLLTRLELTGTEAITVDSNAFSSNTTSGITLVLNSEATNATIGVEVKDATPPYVGLKLVTFNTGGNPATVSVIFSDVEYIN